MTLDKLTPMTVLLGPNGSGKSTIFDVFNFLSECFQYGLLVLVILWSTLARPNPGKRGADNAGKADLFCGGVFHGGGIGRSAARHAGRGMGLPVTMGILKTHGGCITVENEAGCGCVFRVYLPVSTEKKPVKHEKETTPKENVENDGTVLLIEDEETVRNMTKTMLTRLGYKVIEAQDGVEAVSLFQEHQNEIDCVLSDLTMPRMNGWETLTALREKGADVPVILASGYDKDTVMAGDHPEVPQAFLNKPYSMAALKDVLLEVIRL